MASDNKVILVGNLGADPETRYMPNGDAVANIRLATTESWKDKASGEKKEITEFNVILEAGFQRAAREEIEVLYPDLSATEAVGRGAKKFGEIYTQVVRYISTTPEIIDSIGPIREVRPAKGRNEAGAWLDTELPTEWAVWLDERAERCYAKSAHFHKLLHGAGDRGRDALYRFMRHWLASRMKRERLALFRRMPRGFAMGVACPLPGSHRVSK